MRKLATIQCIQELYPIEGKDKIKLAQILGWKVIVDSTFKVGENIVFVEVDSVLPVKPEFEFLRKRCFSESQNGFVIRTMKMGGVISQGIVFHLGECLDLSEYWSEGRDVTDIIGVKQREDNADVEKIPQKKKTYLQSLVYRLPLYKYFKNKFKDSGDFPTNLISKSDETRIQSLGDRFLQNHIGKKIVITEKVEGQSATYVLRKVNIFGFTFYKFRTLGRNNHAGPGHNIYNFAKNNDVEKKLKAFLKDNNYNYVAVQGEMTGPKIQANYYNFEKHRFFVFKVSYDHKHMCFPCLKDFCEYRGFEHVPVIKVEELTSDKDMNYWISQATGKSVLTDGLREGLVVRSLEVNKDHFTDFSFKTVSPEYCLQRGY